jgi:Domain of unknown function (DUF4360)
VNAIGRIVRTTLVAALVLLVPAPAHAEDVPPPGSVAIDLVTMNGTGCQPGLMTVLVHPENAYFGIIYRGYRAQAGGASRPTEFRKNCQLNLRVRAPRGYTHAIRRVEQGGAAHVAEGAQAVQRSSFYYKGQMPPIWPNFQIRGPYDGMWQRGDNVEYPVFLPCGADWNVNINTELRINKGTSAPSEVSFISQGIDDWPAARGADDPTFDGVAKYYLYWRRCA